jgi:hypothetical protein
MNRQYHPLYDSYYDADTGEWLENECPDPDCWYCSKRPEKAPIEPETKEN